MLHKISTPILVAILIYHGYNYYLHYNLTRSLENYAASKGYQQRPVKTAEQNNHNQKMFGGQIIKVTDDIYVATGYALGNSIMVIGGTGVVIIDTTESLHQARVIAKSFRNITQKPVVGIVYTHNHVDHVKGTEAFLEFSTNRQEVQIWAHHSLVDIYFHSTRRIGKAHFYRGMHQFGVFLPGGAISAGIGHKLHVKRDMHVPFVPPNRFLRKEQQTIEIAGIRLTLMHVPGETDDTICVYWEEKSALLGTDNLYKAFPNLYAIRGTPFRSLKLWYESLDKMRNLKPEYFVMSHHVPLIGREEVYKTMTYYRDAVQLVHDQTVRFINQGLHPDEIARRIQLPTTLKKHPYLQELYGTVRWSSKSLFSGYMGWFSGDISELDPLTPNEKCTRLVDLTGGTHKILEVAKVALKEKDYQWSLYLSSCIERLAPSSREAKEIKAKALFDIAEQQSSFNGYNYYKTAAYVTLGTVKIELDEKAKKVAIKDAKMPELFYLMSLKFMTEKCIEYNKIIEFSFPDINETVMFHARNGILDMSGIYEDEKVSPDIIVKVDSTTWRLILTGEKSGLLAVVGSEISVEPGLLHLREFLSCFETD